MSREAEQLALQQLEDFEVNHGKPIDGPKVTREWQREMNQKMFGDEDSRRTYQQWHRLVETWLFQKETTRRLEKEAKTTDLALLKRIEPMPDPPLPVEEMAHYWVRPYLSTCALELVRCNRDIEITNSIDPKERSKYSFSQEKGKGCVVTARSRAIAKVFDLLVRLDKIIESKGNWGEVEETLVQAEWVFEEFEGLMPQMVERTVNKEPETYSEPGSVYALLDYPNVIDVKPFLPEEHDTKREPLPDQLLGEDHVLDLSERLDPGAFRQVLTSLSADELQTMIKTLTSTMRTADQPVFWDIIGGITPKGRDRLRQLRFLRTSNQSMARIVAMIEEVQESRKK